MVLRLIVVMSMMLVSCGEDSSPKSSGGADAVSGGFLSNDFFKADDSVAEISATDLANSIRDIDYVYLPAEAANSLALQDEDLGCAVKQDEITLTGDQLVMKYTYDDSTCTEIDDKYINKMRVFISISCSGQDLSSFTEGSVRSHIYTNGASDFCPNAKEQSTFINAELTRESATDMATVMGGIMTAGGGPCVTSKTGEELTTNNCTFYLKTTKGSKDAEDSTTTKLLTLTANGLKGQAGDIYYSEGSMAIRLNNWQGELNFSAGNIGPTYTLSSGEDEVEGSFKGGLK